jgi:hypothetical protein
MSLLPVIPSTSSVYCAAFTTKSTTTITAVNLVKQEDNVADIPSYSTGIEVLVPGLNALTDYEVYCYVENVFGIGNSLATVVATKTATTTTCCNEVSFTSAPSSIYLSTQKYALSSMIGKNIFTCSLSGAPSSSVTVSCLLTNSSSGDILGSSFKCRPASKTFTSSSLLSSRFFISGPTTLSLGVTVSLAISGTSAGDYYSDVTPVAVSVLASNVLPPAPKLLSATFAGSGLYVSVVFDSDSNMYAPSTTSSWNCAKLFLFDGANNSYCSWQSASIVIVQFPTVKDSVEERELQLVTAGDDFYLLGDLLAAFCPLSTSTVTDDYAGDDDSMACWNYPTQSLMHVSVSAPPDSAITKPSPILVLPSEHCICDDLTVDLSASFGSAGRPWFSVSFLVLESSGSSYSQTSNSDLIEELLSTASLNTTGVFVISSEDLPVGTFSIQVTVTNFLGGSSSVTSYISLHSIRNKPVLLIAAKPSMTIAANEKLSITGQATLPSCADATTYFQYYWNVTDSSTGLMITGLESQSADPKRLLLAANSLTGGYGYTVTFIVYSVNGTDNDGTVLASSSAEVEVFVSAPNVQLVIAGGYVLSPPVDSDLTLDASSSIVIDSSGNDMEYNVTWSCEIESLGESYGDDCGIFSSTIYSALSVTIVANTLSSSEIYRINVVLTAEDGSTDVKSVLVTPASASTAIVTMISTFSDASSYNKFVIDASVEQSISSTDDLVCTWSVTFAGNAVNVTGQALTSTSLTVTNSELSSMSSTFIIPFAMPAGSLVARRSYTFTLTVCSSASSTLCSYTQATVLMHAAPSGGYTSVNPTSGTALLDSFTVLSAGWVADVECYPFLFDFSTRLSTGHHNAPLALQSGSATVAALLPAGLEAFNYELLVVGTVTDSVGALAFESTTVTVNSPESVDVVTILAETYSSFPRTSDYSLLFQTFGSITSFLNKKNCSGAPNCASLNREGCYEMVNTCGSCLTNYYGVVGPDNSECRAAGSTIPVGGACNLDSQCIYGQCGVRGLTVGSLPVTVTSQTSYADSFVPTSQPTGRPSSQPTGQPTSNPTADATKSKVCVAPYQQCPSATPGTVCSDNGLCLFEDSSGTSLFSCTVEDIFCTPRCACESGYYGEDCSLNATQFAVQEASRVSMCEALYVSASTQDRSPQLVDALVGNLVAVYDPKKIATYDGHVTCMQVLTLLADLSLDGHLTGTKSQTVAYLMEIVSAFSSIASTEWTTVYNVTTNSTNSSTVVNGTNITTTAYDYVEIERTESIVNISSLTNVIMAGISKTLVAGEAAVTIATDNVQVMVQNVRLSSLANSSLSPPATTAGAAYGTLLPAMQLSADGLGSSCGGGSGYAQLSLAQWGKNPHPNSSSIKSPLLSIGTESTTAATTRRQLSSTNVTVAPAYFIVLQFSSRQALNFSDFGNVLANQTLPACSFYDGSGYVSCSGCNISSYTEYNVTYGCYDTSVLCSDGGSSSSRRLGEDDQSAGSSSSSSFSSYGMILEALAAEIAHNLSINPFAIDLSKAKAVLIFVGILLFVMVFGIIYFMKWDAYDHNRLAYLRTERMEKKRAKREGKELKKQLSKEESKKGLISIDKIMDKAFTVRTSSWGEYVANLVCCRYVKFDSMLGQEGGDGDEDEDKMEIINSTSFDQDELADEDDADDHMRGVLGQAKQQIDDMNAMKDSRNPGSGKEQSLNIDVATQSVAVIKNFMDEAMPPRALLAKGDILRRFISALATFHPYVCMLSHPSCMTTRTMRWLSVTRGILLALFVDTLFFGICYPDTGTCGTLTTEELCLALPSKLQAGTPMCLWDEATAVCSMAPPPSSLIFTMSISLLCVLLNIPLDMTFGYIIDEFAAKRPHLEDVPFLNLNSESWLGTGNPKPIWTEDQKREMEAEERLAVHHNSALRDVLVENNAKTQADKKAQLELAHVPDSLYYDYATSEEEVSYILNEVRRFWMDEYDNHAFAASQHTTVEQMTALQDAKARALMEILKVYPNGAPMPLTFTQWLQYGTSHNKLYKTIEKVRSKAKDIGEELQMMIQLNIAKSVNVFLIQHFVMEQVSSITRFALARQLFNYKELAPFGIDFLPWFLAWIMAFFVFAFFFYWIFTWGVVNGGTTLGIWGINFFIGCIQDFAFVQPAKIFILCIVSVECAKPQLRAIHRRLLYVTLSMLPQHQDNARLCPGTHRSLSVVQHTSVACRAARMRSVYEFPAAYILRELNDLDMQSCRERKGVGFGTVLFIIVGVPALIGLISDLAIDQLMEVFLPSVFSGFVIFNATLYNINVGLMLLPYLVIVALLVYRFAVLGPSVHRMKLMNRRKVYKLQRGNWRESKRKTTGTISASSAYYSIRWKRFKNNFARCVIALSKPLFPKSVKKAKYSQGDSKLTKPAPHLMWQRMNSPIGRQGMVMCDVGNKYKDALEAMDAAIGTAETQTVIQNNFKADYQIPEPIMMMIPESEVDRPDSNNNKGGDNVSVGFWEKHLFDCDTRFEDMVASWRTATGLSKREITVHRDWNAHTGNEHDSDDGHIERVGAVGADVKTTDVEVALQAMYEYIIFNSNEDDEHSHIDSVLSTNVDAKHLWMIRKLFYTSKKKMEAFKQAQLDKHGEDFVRNNKVPYAQILREHQRKQQQQRRADDPSFPVHCYESVMRYVWSIYYPVGIPLSSEELEEAAQEFRMWLSRYTAEQSSNPHKKLLLPYNSFESWFVSYVDDVVRYREFVFAHRDPMIPPDEEDLWIYNAADETKQPDVAPQMQIQGSFFTMDWGMSGFV